MHEMSLVGDVVDVAERYARENGASRVVRIDLRIGEMRDVVDSLLEGCFAHLSKGTPTEGAKLCFEKVPLRARCRSCNLVFPVDMRSPRPPVCPDCASGEASLFSGWEFTIERIEIV